MGGFKGPLRSEGSVSTSEQSTPPTSIPRIRRVFDKQGAHGLKARPGLMRVQTFCKIKYFFCCMGRIPMSHPGVEIITKAEKKLTVASVVVTF